MSRFFSSATAIAWLALILSAFQFAFSVPLLTQFYIRPDLLVTGPPLDLKKQFTAANGKEIISTITFAVSNEGNAAATKIEIGFIVKPADRVQVAPAISANIVEQKDPAFFKTVRIEVERLSPAEHFQVTVFPGPTDPSKDKGSRDFFAGLLFHPTFSFVRSAEGPGRYAAAEGKRESWTGSGKFERK
jgi:hypothetical protein